MGAKRTGHVLLMAAGMGLGVHLWVIRGAFLSLRSEDGDPERLFISAGTRSLAAGLILGSAVVYLLHAIVRLVSRHGATNPVPFSGRDAAWAKPLLLFWASAIGLLAITPGLGQSLSVLSFFIVDLRVWWTALAVAAAALRSMTALQGSDPLHLKQGV